VSAVPGELARGGDQHVIPTTPQRRREHR
jgi:hypothetical protein